MKTFLFDYTNLGIIYVDEVPINSRWRLSLLRSCLLDTEIARVLPFNPLYADFNNNTITEKFYHLDRVNDIAIGKAHEFNEYHLEKQRRARLMMPLINKLIEAISKRSHNSLNEYGIPMDDTIAFEVAQSDPELGNFSSGIVEYAKTLEITPAQAYQELQLDYKTYHAVKMRTYAVTKKYISLIREVRTQEQSNELLNNIQQKLINDTFI